MGSVWRGEGGSLWMGEGVKLVCCKVLSLDPSVNGNLISGYQGM